ncbi:M20/M25/M40 family metallo-hydrolase [Streptococcus castoreus]|uniref:M20/M25/M40 family metallo-hydrolase n=1 Tax=Streptococcus castoreus TaxID=254786 RepID=UPI00040B5714|nr:M20/M25/M40 family metallo-hydrolase [Streptococcus castoreus]
MLIKELEQKISEIWSSPLTQTYLDVLGQLIAHKSIFAQQVGLKETAQFLEQVFKEAGAQVLVDQSYAAPFILAEFKSSRPKGKTVIFYQHYDTVPADDDQKWTSDPFTLTEREGYLYARGVDDDKGHIIARLTAVMGYLNRHKELPLNIIFMMEGAEESASVDLEAYLRKYATHLQGADLLIWEQGIRNEQGQLELTGGNKGILTFDMTVESASLDIHSKYGGVINSASWYLLEAITSLRDAQGRILVPGIYEQVQEPTERELALIETYAIDQMDALKKLYGLELPMLQSDQYDFLRTYYYQPSVGIQGVGSGYQGKGVKTIIPSQAFAKMEVRLVPGLDPERVFKQIQAYLLDKGFDKVNLTYTLGEKGYRSDLSADAIYNLIAVAKSFYPQGISLLPTSAGTGPMHTVFEIVQVPMVAFGLGHVNSCDHAGDENIAIADYCRHILLIEELIKSYE